MSKEIILVPDKCVFKSWIELNYGLSILDDIEKVMGPIIINKYLHDDITNEAEVIDSFFIRNSWSINLSNYYDTYIEILSSISKKYNITMEALQKDMLYIFKKFLRKFRMFNPGIAQDDISLLVISQYLKQYTKYSPVIISDDSDILIHGHIFSSFFGIPNTIISIYELLKYTNKKDIINEYIAYRELPPLKCTDFLVNNKKEDIINEIKELTKKNLLSLHPYLPNDDHFYTVTRM